jgi:hypothetical protein
LSQKQAADDFKRQLTAMEAIRNEIRSKRDDVERLRFGNELAMKVRASN